MRTPGKRVECNSSREFESRPLRQSSWADSMVGYGGGGSGMFSAGAIPDASLPSALLASTTAGCKLRNLGAVVALFHDTLLTLGYARLLVIEPNHAHARAMLDEELDAQAARVGLWAACSEAR